VPWAWVDEHVYAAIRGCSEKVLQNERRLNIGCTFRRINGTTIRYKLGDITAFLESQPQGGGSATPGKRADRGRGRQRRRTTT
jgi:phenylacetate-coenzyme A ligase PaaK-like adenylate-forming protein